MRYLILFFILTPFVSNSQCAIPIELITDETTAFQIAEMKAGETIRNSVHEDWILELELRRCADFSHSIIMITSSGRYFFRVPQLYLAFSWMSEAHPSRFYLDNVKGDEQWKLPEFELRRCTHWRNSGQCKRYTYESNRRCWQHSSSD